MVRGLMLALALLQQPEKQDTLQFSIDNSFIQHLNGIADTATIEYVRCLLGGMRNDTTVITAVFAPAVRRASRFSAVTAACPALVTVGTWHNHLAIELVVKNGDTTTVALPPRMACYLSEMDVRNILEVDIPRGVTITVVQVDRNTVCWWLTSQVKELIGSGGIRYLKPVRGQVSWN